jgi:aspartyl-tRNA(Asn)/glutamyl-tRNA(Gln) amidotransferase subunit B
VTEYQPTIGLEVHCELSTATKLFCGCPNEFGAEPNTNICPVCLGLPGSLPVLNATTVEFALRLAEALAFDVPERSIFARKNYFYPDMPKDYQVSQYEDPILADGVLDVGGTPIRIERAHLEEDTGKSQHIGGGGRIHGADHSLIDYNRAGVPLMEIVSRPDITSAEQARGYVTELRAVLLAIGVSDVKMEEGSMRVDANVSVRPVGATGELGTKVEVKNMNSMRSLGRAIDHEIERQIVALEAGERLVQETRHWDENDGRTHGMRSKEGSSDYRYFPEPDLLPVAPTEAQRAQVRGSLPELPAAKRERLVAEWGVAEHDARVLVGVPGLAAYADAAVLALSAGTPKAGTPKAGTPKAGTPKDGTPKDGTPKDGTPKAGTPKDVANWCVGEVLAYLNDSGLSPAVLPLAPDGLAELVGLVADGTLSRGLAKDVLEEALREPKRPKQIVEERGLAQVSDEGELASVIDTVIAANTETVESYRSGDEKLRKKKRGFLMGEAMKATKGQGNPQLLNRLLDDRLST